MDGSAAEDAGDLLEDVSVFVYHDGKLAASSYSEGPDIPVMRLKSGLAYSIYAVANMGRCTPPEEESVLAGTEHFINGPDALGTGIVPMSAKGRVTVEGSHCRVDIPFVRLAAPPPHRQVPSPNDALTADRKSIRASLLLSSF